MKHWLCSISLEDNEPIRSLNLGTTQNIVSMSRKYIAYLILSCSAAGKSFTSAKEFSDEFKLPNNHVELVWDLFVKSDVLRESNGRYSANEWMAANGLIGNEQSDQKQLDPPKQIPTSQIVEEKIENKIDEEIVNLKRNTDVDMPPEVLRRYQESVYEAKEYVRPNVRLSRNDLLYLKKSLNDAQIERVLDRLSDWKREKGIAYKPGNFDFDQINNWVINWLRIEENKERREFRFTQRPPFKSFNSPTTDNQQQSPADEFPSWIMGN